MPSADLISHEEQILAGVTSISWNGRTDVHVAPFLAQAKEVAWEYLKCYAAPSSETRTNGAVGRAL
jgi:hypothetical protein